MKRAPSNSGIEHLERVANDDREIIVVEANHDIGLDRYIREGRDRHDAPNIRLGLKLEDAMLDHRAQVAVALDADQAHRASLWSSMPYGVL